MKLRFRPAAQRELIAAGRWYREDGGVATSERFQTAVQRAADLLTAHPAIGTPHFEGVRTWPVKGFPYTLVYRVQGDVLTIVAVAHQHREPGYWQAPG